MAKLNQFDQQWATRVNRVYNEFLQDRFKDEPERRNRYKRELTNLYQEHPQFKGQASVVDQMVSDLLGQEGITGTLKDVGSDTVQQLGAAPTYLQESFGNMLSGLGTQDLDQAQKTQNLVPYEQIQPQYFQRPYQSELKSLYGQEVDRFELDPDQLDREGKLIPNPVEDRVRLPSQNAPIPRLPQTGGATPSETGQDKGIFEKILSPITSVGEMIRGEEPYSASDTRTGVQYYNERPLREVQTENGLAYRPNQAKEAVDKGGQELMDAFDNQIRMYGEAMTTPFRDELVGQTLIPEIKKFIMPYIKEAGQSLLEANAADMKRQPTPKTGVGEGIRSLLTSSAPLATAMATALITKKVPKYQWAQDPKRTAEVASRAALALTSIPGNIALLQSEARSGIDYHPTWKKYSTRFANDAEKNHEKEIILTRAAELIGDKKFLDAFQVLQATGSLPIGGFLGRVSFDTLVEGAEEGYADTPIVATMLNMAMAERLAMKAPELLTSETLTTNRWEWAKENPVAQDKATELGLYGGVVTAAPITTVEMMIENKPRLGGLEDIKQMTNKIFESIQTLPTNNNAPAQSLVNQPEFKNTIISIQDKIENNQELDAKERKILKWYNSLDESIILRDDLGDTSPRTQTDILAAPEQELADGVGSEFDYYKNLQQQAERNPAEQPTQTEPTSTTVSLSSNQQPNPADKPLSVTAQKRMAREMKKLQDKEAQLKEQEDSLRQVYNDEILRRLGIEPQPKPPAETPAETPAAYEEGDAFNPVDNQQEQAERDAERDAQIQMLRENLQDLRSRMEFEAAPPSPIQQVDEQINDQFYEDITQPISDVDNLPLENLPAPPAQFDPRTRGQKTADAQARQEASLNLQPEFLEQEAETTRQRNAFAQTDFTDEQYSESLNYDDLAGELGDVPATNQTPVQGETTAQAQARQEAAIAEGQTDFAQTDFTDEQYQQPLDYESISGELGEVPATDAPLDLSEPVSGTFRRQTFDSEIAQDQENQALVQEIVDKAETEQMMDQASPIDDLGRDASTVFDVELTPENTKKSEVLNGITVNPDTKRGQEVLKQRELEVLKDIMKQYFPNASDVVVLETMEDLKKLVTIPDTATGVEGATVSTDGGKTFTVYLIGENLKGTDLRSAVEKGVKIYHHESIGHAGIQTMLGPQKFQRFANKLYNRRQAEIDAFIEQRYPNGMPNDTPTERVREWLAQNFTENGVERLGFLDRLSVGLGLSGETSDRGIKRRYQKIYDNLAKGRKPDLISYNRRDVQGQEDESEKEAAPTTTTVDQATAEAPASETTTSTVDLQPIPEVPDLLPPTNQMIDAARKRLAIPDDLSPEAVDILRMQYDLLERQLNQMTGKAAFGSKAQRKILDSEKLLARRMIAEMTVLKEKLEQYGANPAVTEEGLAENPSTIYSFKSGRHSFYGKVVPTPTDKQLSQAKEKVKNIRDVDEYLETRKQIIEEVKPLVDELSSEQLQLPTNAKANKVREKLAEFLALQELELSGQVVIPDPDLKVGDTIRFEGKEATVVGFEDGQNEEVVPVVEDPETGDIRPVPRSMREDMGRTSETTVEVNGQQVEPATVLPQNKPTQATTPKNSVDNLKVGDTVTLEGQTKKVEDIKVNEYGMKFPVIDGRPRIPESVGFVQIDPDGPMISLSSNRNLPPNAPKMGINVRTDQQAQRSYADLIVDGEKSLESRNTDSLRPYVGQRMAIVRTGEGQAQAIGEVTVGEPQVVNQQQFRALQDQHLVSEGSTFDIQENGQKYLYPMENPVRYDNPAPVGRGIVARQVNPEASFSSNRQQTPDEMIEDIQEVLTIDLLQPRFREAAKKNKFCGHCYAASEALYHMMGAKDSGYTPTRAQDADGIVHWWLQDDEGNILDPTADQYYSIGKTPPYSTGRGGGFMSQNDEQGKQKPSKRAKEIIRRVKENKADQQVSFSANRAQTETPEFNNWFKQSVVRDTEGNPKVMYHGSKANIDTFDYSKSVMGQYGRGFYFAPNPEAASRYAEGTGSSKGESVYPVYLSVQNPIDLAAPVDTALWTELGDQLGIDIRPALNTAENPSNSYAFTNLNMKSSGMRKGSANNRFGDILRDFLKSKGYDGIKTGRGNYVAFDPEQIKSVFNKGTFDPNDQRISFSSNRQQTPPQQPQNTRDVESVRGVLASVDMFLDPKARLPHREELENLLQETRGKQTRIIESGRKFATVFMAATPDEQKLIKAFMENRNADPNLIPDRQVSGFWGGKLRLRQLTNRQLPTLREAAVQAKKEIEQIGLDLVRLGQISLETFKNRRGKYLPRVYLKYLLDESQSLFAGGANLQVSDQGYRKQLQDIDEQTRILFLGEIESPGYLVGRTLLQAGQDIAKMDFLNAVAQNKEWVLPDSQVKLNISNLVNDIITRRNLGQRLTQEGFPAATRQKADRRVSPEFLMAEADRIEEQILPTKKPGSAQEELVQAIANEYRKLGNAARNKIRGYDHKAYRQLPNSNRYGDLRGAYVRKEIANLVMGDPFFINKEAASSSPGVGWASDLERTASTFNSIFKWKMTAASPTAWMNNLKGNTGSMAFAGLPVHRNLDYRLRAGYEILRNGDRYQQYKDLGLIQTTFAADELGRMNSDFKTQLTPKERKLVYQNRTMNALRSTASFQTAMNILGRIYNTFGDIYQGLEIVDKLAVAMYLEDHGANIAGVPFLNQEEMSASDAMKEANKYLFDYSDVDPAIKKVRKSLVGAPFITWTYKQTDLLRKMMKDPQAMLRAASYYAMVYAYIVSQESELDDDEYEAYLKALPEYYDKHGMLTFPLPTKDENGRIQIEDLFYAVPHAYLYQFLTTAVDPKYGGWEAISDLGFFNHPLLKETMQQTANKDFYTGREISSKFDDLGTGIDKRFKHFRDTVMPSLFSPTSWERQLLETALQAMEMNPNLFGERANIFDYRGEQKKTFVQTINRMANPFNETIASPITSALGFSEVGRPIDLEGGLRFQIRDLQNYIRERAYNQEKNRIAFANDPENLRESEKEFQKEYRDLLKQIAELQKALANLPKLKENPEFTRKQQEARRRALGREKVAQ
jgi:hypothetical protein